MLGVQAIALHRCQCPTRYRSPQALAWLSWTTDRASAAFRLRCRCCARLRPRRRDPDGRRRALLRPNLRPNLDGVRHAPCLAYVHEFARLALRGSCDDDDCVSGGQTRSHWKAITLT